MLTSIFQKSKLKYQRITNMSERKYYLTKEGVEKVKKELEEFKEQKKHLLNGHGPRSFRFGEIDAEYFAFREELDRVEEKIAEIEEVLENCELIKAPSKKERDKISLGAKVLVEIDGEEDEFLLVDMMEADPSIGKISKESPVGRALMGHKKGDKVIVTSPLTIEYKIKKVSYNK